MKYKGIMVNIFVFYSTVETLEKRGAELETKLTETEHQLEQVSSQLKQKEEQFEKEREENDSAFDTLRSQLEKSEQTRKELVQKVGLFQGPKYNFKGHAKPSFTGTPRLLHRN